MASAVPSYKIRGMTIEDHAAVKEIAAATWKGHVHDYDYVIDAFPHWLNTDESVPLALLDQEETVLAFTNVRFIDEGKTAWVEGTRVHPDHRKKNLGTSLLEHCKVVARERGAKLYRYSTSVDNYGSIRMAEKLHLKNADYHHCVFLNMEQAQGFASLLGVSQADGEREFERVSAADLHVLIQSHPIFSKHKYFVAGWSVYLPQLEALLAEEKKGAEFYVNKRADPSQPISTYTYGKRVEIISCSRGDSTTKWVIGIRSISPDLLYRSIAYNYYIAKEKECALVDIKFDTEFGEEFHKKIQTPIEKFGMYVFEADL